MKHGPPDPDLAPIFVIGTGRSGTTLMRNMLCRHPRIHIAHEPWLYSVHGALGQMRGSTYISVERFVRHYARSLSFAFLGIDEAEMRQAVGDARSRADVFRAILRVTAQRHGKTRYGDKTPDNSRFLAEIFDDFPDARVVHMVRDPVDMVASWSRMPWGGTSHWLNSWLCNTRMKEVAPYRGRICEVLLEELLDRPEETMRRVLDFVGEAWAEIVLDPQANPDDLPGFPWFEKAGGRIQGETDPGQERRGARQLGKTWTRKVERMNSYSLRRYYRGTRYYTLPLDSRKGFAARLSTLAYYPAILLCALVDIQRCLLTLLRLYRYARQYSREKVPPLEKQFDVFNINARRWRGYPGGFRRFQQEQVARLESRRPSDA